MKPYDDCNSKMQSANVIRQLGLIRHPEGGYFLETYRSGSENCMKTKGQTDSQVPTNYVKAKDNKIVLRKGTSKYESLCLTVDRQHCRPDGDDRRNCLTSLLWMPTTEQPLFHLCHNYSDHVHYWQGGLRFEYFVYDPDAAELKSYVMGPDVAKGEHLQVPVAGGTWKCGRLLVDSDDETLDYCLIGEAVAPGFDFYDFSWVTKEKVMVTVADVDHRDLLETYVHVNIDDVSGQEAAYATQFYQ